MRTSPPPSPSDKIEYEPLPRVAWLVLAAIVALKAGIHLLAIDSYGYFRDELYYLASTRHMDLGYVEHPPFSIWLLAAHTTIFGDSLIAVRALSLLAGCVPVLCGGLMARRLGGGVFAQGVAALAAAAAPELMGSGNFYSMNVIEQALWAVSGILFLRLLPSPEPRDWLLLGFVLGIGLLTKVSVFWLGAGMFVALFLTRQRRWLATVWPWLTGLIALFLFLPFLYWQARYDFPMLEFISNATSRKMMTATPGEYGLKQILGMNPLAFPVIFAGLAGPWISRTLRTSRVPVLIFLTVAVILLASGTAKTYYLAAAYVFLFAAGGRSLELFCSSGEWREGLKVLVPTLILAGLFLSAPLAIPLLTPEGFLKYSRVLGISPEAEERASLGPLPQHFADQFGWQELAAEVARVYNALPPEDRAKAAIFGQNYGHAGAIDVLGRRLGLPPAICGHNTYWIWGPGTFDGSVLIIIGGDFEDHVNDFDSLVESGVSDHPLAMPYERHLRIFVGRKLKAPVKEAWKEARFYI